MNILILGSGGREHALAWKVSQSKLTGEIYIAPGNAGTATLGTNIELSPNDFKAVADFAIAKSVELIIVGPEEPLVRGIVDYFRSTPSLAHIRLIGPSQEAAQLEGSKDFAKQFMEKYNIPTAASQTFEKEDIASAKAFLKTLKPPYVLKADGLAAGKGVLIIDNIAEAEAQLEDMLVGESFGEASRKVVVEAFLEGIEISIFVLTDGKNYVLLPSAKDYKRIGEGDSGLNTGGMGAVSPVPFADETLLAKIEAQVVKPTIKGIETEGLDYCGFVFIGLMIVDGEPVVLEYNVRMGDPETQVVMKRLESDFVALLTQCADKKLNEAPPIVMRDTTAITLVMVSGGYPEKYEKHKLIHNMQNIAKDITVFQAGTYAKGTDVYTNGGRVLAVTAQDSDLEQARQKALAAAHKIDFEGKYFRTDIGLDLTRERSAYTWN
ncbi:MAG: phosphoribosylamine--glycine ligase [Bernardetiaceae bacterium]|nr:phosphoribosylamine--glycine ligase [Bernardetiaceae bacterium]